MRDSHPQALLMFLKAHWQHHQTLYKLFSVMQSDIKLNRAVKDYVTEIKPMCCKLS